MANEAGSGLLDTASVSGGGFVVEEEEVKVKEVSPRVLRDYEGMNSESARRLGFPWKYGEDTILVDATMSAHRKTQVVEHERFEKMLEERGMSYW